MTVAVERLLTEHLDTWTAAVETKSAAGRGSSKKLNLVGIKKLRELILELAVRGQLVPQDESDEPAEVLLARIAAERERLVKEKKIKKPKKLPEISEEEKPFDLPVGWAWTRLGELALESSAGWSPKCLPTPRTSDNWGVLKVSAVTWGHYQFDENKELPNDLEPRSECEVKDGDFLISRANTAELVARAVVVPERSPKRLMMSDKIIRFIFSKEASSEYINLVNNSQTSRNYYLTVAGGTSSSMKNVSREQVRNLLLPLPPLNEQLKIVAKVDELMALCDALEQEQESSIAAHTLLVENLLAALTNAANQGEFKQAWARVAANFDTLFTTEQSVEQLKQTILQLAVMGKLVEQDPADEPAGVLLERIAAEKARLVQEKKIKKQKALPEISEEEKVFELPEGWEWCRLQDVIDVRDGTHNSPKDAVGENTFPLVTSKDFKSGDIDFGNARRISAADHEDISKRSLVEVDDILFSMIGGNIGNQVMVKSNIEFSIKNVALFKHYDKSVVLPRFLKIYTENLAERLQDQASGGAQPFISLGALRKLIFLLPPVDEQARIVDKVCKLVEVCDLLQISINKSQETQVLLANVLSDSVVA